MIGVLNAIIAGLGNILTATIGLLPQSPFTFVQELDSAWLKNINYIFPVNSAIAHLEVYLLAVASYYAIRIVLRWIKAVGN